eukprot:scaffold198566_cov14-Tisochrysis_lutea.AAC.2
MHTPVPVPNSRLAALGCAALAPHRRPWPLRVLACAAAPPYDAQAQQNSVRYNDKRAWFAGGVR